MGMKLLGVHAAKQAQRQAQHTLAALRCYLNTLLAYFATFDQQTTEFQHLCSYLALRYYVNTPHVLLAASNDLHPITSL